MESIPLIELSTLAKYINAKIQEVSQNTDLHMRDFLVIDKALQTTPGQLVMNT